MNKLEKAKQIILTDLTTGCSCYPAQRLSHLTVRKSEKQTLDGAVELKVHFAYNGSLKAATYWLDQVSCKIVAQTSYV